MVRKARARQRHLKSKETRKPVGGSGFRAATHLMGGCRQQKDYILAVLDRNGGNQSRTCEQLRIGSATLYRKLKEYGRVRSRSRGKSKG